MIEFLFGPATKKGTKQQQTILHLTMKLQHNTTQHNTAQHSTAQHNTAQHNTAQHNTAQHSTQPRMSFSFVVMLTLTGRILSKLTQLLLPEPFGPMILVKPFANFPIRC
jgi:hypothetical protein